MHFVKKKIAAHDRWACFRCRFSTKRLREDVRATNRSSYTCPTCNQRMRWTGTAFRPPRKQDDEAWRVAERLIAAGVRFRSTRQRQRLPKTLRELKEWTKEQAGRDTWLPERKLSIVCRGDRKITARSGPRTLAHGECVLVYHGGRWKTARVKFRGDGGRPLVNPVVTLVRTNGNVPITARTRLRTRGDGKDRR
jgi:hypothetical protein